MMAWIARALTTTTLVLLAVPAAACVIDARRCESADTGRVAIELQMASPPENISAFEEYPKGDLSKADRMYLVECGSRKGVMADLSRGLPDETRMDAESFLDKAATSKRRYTLTEIRNELRDLGLSAEVISLPEGHCGCDLPTQPFDGCGNAP